jgi:hypothetical protein
MSNKVVLYFVFLRKSNIYEQFNMALKFRFNILERFHGLQRIIFKKIKLI